MAGPINLRLLTDFFNKIGPSRRILRWNLASAYGALRSSREAGTDRIGRE
jgi:hypothetical protein